MIGIRRARAAVCALLGLLSTLGMSGPAGAAENGVEFTIRPGDPDYSHARAASWLLHRGDEGEVIRDSVVVENLGTKPLNLVLYPTDAATTAQGAFALQPREAPAEDVAGWVSLGRDRVRVRPGERVRVPLRIRIPENAIPGDHPGGIVARLSEPVGEGPVGAYLAVGARLYLSVEGPRRPRLELISTSLTVRDGRPMVTSTLENAGNTILDVTGSYEVSGWFGLEGSRESLGPAMELVPGARVTRAVRYPDRLLGGWYAVTLRLNDGEGRTFVREMSVFIPPSPALVLAIVAVLAFLILSAWALGRRGRRVRSADPQPA